MSGSMNLPLSQGLCQWNWICSEDTT